MIKKTKSKYVVMSEKTGRSLGTYRTMKEAKERLRQIEFFKHLKQNPALAKNSRKMSLKKKFSE